MKNDSVNETGGDFASKDLLGCPWCGRKPIKLTLKYRNTGRVFGYLIRCSTCDYEKSIKPACWTEGDEQKTMDAAKAELIKWWNSRKQPNADLSHSARKNETKP